MIVGLTGGIGSGKSTVAKMFRELGVPVYDSDTEAKRLMQSSEALKEGIVSLFGINAYKEGSLNKKLIANIVFKEKEQLERLNALVHPAVRKHFMQWAYDQEKPYVIQESALIYERGMEDNYDAIILVTAPEEIRIQRVIDRDGTTRKEVMARLDNQMPERAKWPLADYRIANEELANTRKKVEGIHNAILSKILP